MLALQAVTPEALAHAARLVTLAEARKIVSAVHRDRALDTPVAQVRRDALAAVRAAGDVPTLRVHGEEPSSLDPFVKLTLSTHDDHLIETVRIPLERSGRFSVCVSSRVLSARPGDSVSRATSRRGKSSSRCGSCAAAST